MIEYIKDAQGIYKVTEIISQTPFEIKIRGTLYHFTKGVSFKTIEIIEGEIRSYPIANDKPLIKEVITKEEFDKFIIELRNNIS